MTKYQDKLSGFAERLKSEEIRTPIQEVKPVVEISKKVAEPEIQLNIWISKKLMKKIKQKSLDSDMSIKDWVTSALYAHLNNI